MKILKFALRFCALAMTMLAVNVAAQSLNAEVDRNTIGEDETVNLTVRFEGGKASGDPDYTTLSDNFDILQNQKSVQTRMINGDFQMFTEWSLTLAPRRTGKLLIPPFNVQGQASAPITVTVNQASVNPVSGRQDVFLETSVDKSEVYVQEQFIVTYRLYFNRSVDSLNMGDFTVDNARVEELPRVDYQRTIGDTPYGVAEFKYAVFPDASGTIEIPSATWTVRTTDQPEMGRFGFSSGRYRMHRAKTDAVSVSVQPKPEDYPAGAVWLPAADVEIEERWSRSPDQFKVGEPITRTITVSARGVSSEQLPPIVDNSQTGAFKFYPDQPSQDKDLSASGVTGQRTESVAIVPSRSGQLTLPAIEITWWDTDDQSVKRASLPAREIAVAAAPNQPENEVTAASASKPQAQPGSDNGVLTPSVGLAGEPLWFWVSAVLACTTMLFALLWWRTSLRARQALRHPDKAPAPTCGDEQRQFKAIEAACRDRDAGRVRAAVVAWANSKWPEQRPFSLAKFVRKLPENEDRALFERLDSALYGPSEGDLDYARIARCCTAMRKSRDGLHTKQELKPLYATPR